MLVLDLECVCNMLDELITSLINSLNLKKLNMMIWNY
jgi:hypothetical protein